MNEALEKYCGATTRSKGPCRRPAGWGTDHAGEGRCKLHGGLTPIKHGRYSKVKRERVRSLIEAYEADPDPLNVLPEIAAARALFVDFIERYDEWRDALLAWHGSFSEGYLMHLKYVRKKAGTEDGARLLDALQAAYLACLDAGLLVGSPLGHENKPREVLDLADAHRLLGVITKIAQQEKRLMLDGAISRRDLLRIITEMQRVVSEAVPDATTQKRITDGWRSISLA